MNRQDSVEDREDHRAEGEWQERSGRRQHRFDQFQHLPAEVGLELREDRRGEREREQRADGQDQDQVDALAAEEAAGVVALEDHGDRVARRADQRARGDQQGDDADHSERAGVPDHAVDEVLQVAAPTRLAERQLLEQELDRVLASGRIVEDESRHGRRDDRRREHGQQRVVGHARRQLAAVVAPDRSQRVEDQRPGSGEVELQAGGQGTADGNPIRRALPSPTTSGRGGTGRRARFRSWWA